MEFLSQIILNALFLSGLYSLIAIAVTLIFGILRIGDFAQGALYAVSAYLVFIGVVYLGLPYLVAGLLAILGVSLLSVIQGHFIYRPLRKIGIGATFLGAVGLLIIIQNILALGFTWDPYALRIPWENDDIQIFGAVLPVQKLLLISATLIALLSVGFFLKRTYAGKALRAISQNCQAAQLFGVNATAITILAFAIAGALSGTAGALMAGIWPITPYAGALLVLKAFAIAIIARGKIFPSILAAMLVGFGESFIQGYWMSQLSDLIPFAMLALVLLMRRDRAALEDERERLPSLAKGFLTDLNKPVWLKLAPALLAIIVLAMALATPLSIQWMHLLVLIGIAIILVSGLDLLSGYTGIPSLAQAGLWGIGAYSSALLSIHFELSFLASLVGAVAITVAAAYFIGLVGLRLHSHWTSFTFLIGVVITLLIASFPSLTGGNQGLVRIPPIEFSLPWLGEISLSPLHNKVGYVYIVFAFVFFALLIKSRIANSLFGRALLAIREDESLALAVGIPATQYKLIVFLISAAFAGVAGSIFAHYYGYLNPDLFTFVQSFNLFVMNLVGGATSLLGPVIGPSVLTLFDEFTQHLNGTLAEIVYGALLIFSLLYLPGGFASLVNRLSSFVRNRIQRTDGMKGGPSIERTNPTSRKPEKII